MERYVFLQTYLEYIEAFHVMEQLLMEYRDSGWSLVETSGIQYMNSAWRVGMSFEKKVDDFPEDVTNENIENEILEFADKGDTNVQ